MCKFFKMESKKCIVASCQNTYSADSNLSFYGLPSTNLPLLQQWLLKIKLTSNPVFQKICSAHFDQNCFVNRSTLSSSESNDGSGKACSLILKSDAVPTLFLDMNQVSVPKLPVIFKTEVNDDNVPMTAEKPCTISQVILDVSKGNTIIPALFKTQKEAVLNSGEANAKTISKKPRYGFNKTVLEAAPISKDKSDRRKKVQKGNLSPADINITNSILQLKCQNCGFETGKQRKMAKHIRYDHITISLKPRRSATSSQPPHTPICDECGYKTNKKSVMKKHLSRIHCPEKPWTCSLCPFTATTESSLDLHVNRKHKYEKKFECGLCRKFRSASRFAIKYHILKKHFDSTKLL